MKALITGHLGFIGNNLCERLGFPGGIDIKAYQDIRTFDFKEKFDVIFHLAAQASIPKSFDNPVESHSHNVMGTLRILEYARKTGAKVVFSSSSSVYGEADTPTKEDAPKNPVSPYAVQKLLCEEYMRFYWTRGVKSCALRYFNVFGEGQDKANGGYALALSIFLNQYKKGEPFTIVGDGEQRRDFVYVKDVVSANIRAADFLQTAEKFEAFNIGGGINYSINQVADFISKDHPRVNLPPRIEPRENLADITKAKELLKWEPKTTPEAWLKQVL